MSLSIKTGSRVSFWIRHQDALIGGLLFLTSLALYVRTLAPSVATIFDDSLEFQLVLPTLSIAHPTGYPLYTLLGWLFTKLVPLGDAAYRANLFSAVAAAAAVAMLFRAANELIYSRLPAVLATVALAVSPVWWSQATIAEVYALHGLLMATLLWLLLRWGLAAMDHLVMIRHRTSIPHSAKYLLWAALVFGLGLAHHRTTLLWLPAIVVYVLWVEPGLIHQPRRWGTLAVAIALPLLLYLYLPLRAPTAPFINGGYTNSWAGFWRHVLATDYTAFLQGNPLNVGATPRFFFELFRNQFGIVGLVLGTLGLIGFVFNPRVGT
ncbi:MAG TPA: DUF2723 domain-containing protein, partial [Anaerolineae bacterium]|nr:DUF2723 domain-containing protein [Anaerolineae bacterium]